MSLLNRLLLGAGALAVGALIYGGVKIDRVVRIGAGYKAKIACSEIFVAGRDADDVIAHEFDGMDAALEQVKVTVDAGKRMTRASGPLGLGGVKAFYRDGYGCTLASGGRLSALPDAPTPVEAAPWEEAKAGSANEIARVDYAAIDAALNDAFASGAGYRAVVVAVDGKIVAEHYADGFTPDTRVQSWSMAKSVTATVFAAAAMRGLADVDDAPPVPEWTGDASKAPIKWNDLLRMQSGLSFGEEYGDIRSDVNRMLFEQADAGGFAARFPVAHAPGEVWYYSSGTTNIVARTLGQVLKSDALPLQQFARDAIFAPLGAASFVLENDTAGSFIGSSYVYATARDWARLGQLYLQDGVWNGERLLPEGWRDYVRTPASASDRQYGAQFWLNLDGESGRPRFFEGVDDQMFFFAGHEGQYVFIIPDKNMVIMRSGVTRGQVAMQAVAPMVRGVYDAVGAAE
ncbi:MAG: serine hydrolase [Parvularculaceae bacterium]